MTPLPANRWFTEIVEESGCAWSLQIEDRVASRQSEFQTTEVYRTTQWGYLMVIDGFVMLTSRDNFLYHEMMAHPALFTHEDPKRVVVIGGGDCGTLREVLRHKSVEHATQVEIDRNVTELALEYFPELCEANDDPRAELRFDDGVQYLADAGDATIDVIIVDSTDPIGPAEGLFGPAFVADCHRALTDGGVMVQQSESPLIHQDIYLPLRRKMRHAGFADVRTLPFPQPCYPSGWWSCTLARKGRSCDDYRRDAIAVKPFDSRYYNAGIHAAALAEPEFMQKLFGRES